MRYIGKGLAAASPLRQALELLFYSAAAAIIASRLFYSAPIMAPSMDSPPPENASFIAPEQAKGWTGRGFLWIDARSDESFAKDHVPGAQLLNEDHWDEQLPAILEHWHPGDRIIVYCDGGGCHASEHVAARLRDAGLSPIYILSGGWPAWIQMTGGSRRR